MANKEVNPQSLVAWVQLAVQLSALGVDVASGIKKAVKAMEPDITNDELDAIVHATQDDAARRKALAENDAAGLGPQPNQPNQNQPTQFGQPNRQQPQPVQTGVAGKLGPTGQPLPPRQTGPLPSPPAGAGPTGTDGVTGTPVANEAAPAAPGKDGLHSAVDRPSGGLPGTVSNTK